MTNRINNNPFSESYLAVFCVTNFTEKGIDFLASIEKVQQQQGEEEPIVYEANYEKFIFA